MKKSIFLLFSVFSIIFTWFTFSQNVDFEATIIWWEKFIDYSWNANQWPQPNTNRPSVKYTSWSNVTVQINSDARLSWYRVSCIQPEKYCEQLVQWSLCDTYSNHLCDLRNDILGSSEWYICSSLKDARTERQPIPRDWKLKRDLENWNDSCRYYDMPYWSKYQWERVVRIQVQDMDGNKSEKKSTDVITYSKENPTIEPNNVNQIWNATNMQITLTTKWWQLKKWTIWIPEPLTENQKKGILKLSTELRNLSRYVINKDKYDQWLLYWKCEWSFDRETWICDTFLEE